MKRIVLGALLAGAWLMPDAAFAAALPATGCHSAESRQFDFWVGKWDVYSKKAPTKLSAHSLIEKLYEGCAVRENWMPNDPANAGGSLNAYDVQAKRWRQFWTDSSGSIAEFTGGWNGKAMVIQGVWPQPGAPRQITRITYTPLADGSVEQRGEASDDGGASWAPSFDLLYRRSAASK